MLLIPQDFTDAEDTYNLSMGHVFQKWPNAIATYTYINRVPDFKFREGFDKLLQEQIEMMRDLRFSQASFDFFLRVMPWLPRPYLQWLRQYRFDPSMVKISFNDGHLGITIKGLIYEACYWEVKLLSIISQLQNSSADGSPYEWFPDWKHCIEEKGRLLNAAGVHFIDFGTRRRIGFHAQDFVVRTFKQYANFHGTSNPFLAMKYDVKPQGTYAHQYEMLMQAMYGARSAARMAMQHWFDTYRGNLGIALSDTLTTSVFLRSFKPEFANQFRGVRQDSGDPFLIGEMLLEHYEKLGIDPMTKVIVFSDSLTVGKAIALHDHFKGRIRTTMGIGTHFTADKACFGYPPMNHVIKLTEIDFREGDGPVQVIKLSDDKGKYTGNSEKVEHVKKELGLA